jgi:hypothetical protein
MKPRVCEVCGYLLQMSSGGAVRLCCRRATFFGLPVPADREKKQSAGGVEYTVDIPCENTADNRTLSAVIEAKKEP